MFSEEIRHIETSLENPADRRNCIFNCCLLIVGGFCLDRHAAPLEKINQGFFNHGGAGQAFINRRVLNGSINIWPEPNAGLFSFNVAFRSGSHVRKYRNKKTHCQHNQIDNIQSRYIIQNDNNNK